jgi:uncharacterized protein YbbK (DUF523 family)
MPPTCSMAVRQPPNLTLVSACLVGVTCRFDGQSCPQAYLQARAARGELLPICPEVVAGLPVPRLPAEIEGAGEGLDGGAVLEAKTRVLTIEGVDVTPAFLSGAHQTLAAVQRWGIQRAILKARSPSCGVAAIYSGQFSGELVPGDGVTAALLRRAGVQVMTETKAEEA